MIDGLKLTFSGKELRKLLDERIADHNGSADHWRHQQSRTKENETEDEPLLPDHMCEHEMKRHEWRVEVLEFIRDHLEGEATYRLGADDLGFGELLPAKPESIEQEEYEERTAVGFHLGRLVKQISGFGCRYLPAATDEWVPPGYKKTRVDVEVGSETIQIDQIEPDNETP